MLTLTKGHPVVAFYVLTITISWTYWIGLLVHGDQVSPGSSATHLPGLLGPVCAAIVITALKSGRTGVARLLRSSLFPSPPWLRGGFLAASPLLVAAVVFGALGLVGVPWPGFRSFLDYPGAPANWSLSTLLLAAFLINGCGEEAGWRGFALAALQPTMGKFSATLVVAFMWLLWHAPLFWLNASMHALLGPLIIGWAFSLLCGAFVLSYVFNGSGASIFAVAVWHTLFNFLVGTSGGSGVPAAVVSTVVMVWGSWVAFRWWRAEHQRSPPNE